MTLADVAQLRRWCATGDVDLNARHVLLLCDALEKAWRARNLYEGLAATTVTKLDASAVAVGVRLTEQLDAARMQNTRLRLLIVGMCSTLNRAAELGVPSAAEMLTLARAAALTEKP